MNKKAPLDIDEEAAEREKYCGLLQEEIHAARSAINTQKQKSSEASGDLSGKLEVFENRGGHKSAVKAAVKVTNMEPLECADWMRAFMAYFDALGGNDQIDMFDQANTNDQNMVSVSVASKVVNMAEPATGEEPIH